jgi:hypothetical protein
MCVRSKYTRSSNQELALLLTNTRNIIYKKTGKVGEEASRNLSFYDDAPSAQTEYRPLRCGNIVMNHY